MKRNTNTNVNNNRRYSGGLIVTDRKSLYSCWLRTGDQYELIGKGGKVYNRSLPQIPAKYKPILNENKIPSRKVEVPNKYDPTKTYTMCEYWSPEVVYEEEKKRLPVFEDISEEGSELHIYQRKGMYEKTVPTYATVVAAMKIRKIVSEKIKKRYYEIAQNALEGCDAGYGIGYIGNEDLKMENGEHIRILQAHNSEGKKIRYYGVFNMSHLNNESVVILHVPEEIAGMIIGKEGKNKKSWEAKLGVKQIRVQPVKCKTVEKTEVVSD